MTKIKQLIAVCDDLKEGKNYHYLLEDNDTEYMGEFFSKPIYSLLKIKNEYYNYALLKDGDISVHFEVYLVPISIIQTLKEHYEIDRKVYKFENIVTPYGKAVTLVRESKLNNVDYIENV